MNKPYVLRVGVQGAPHVAEALRQKLAGEPIRGIYVKSISGSGGVVSVVFEACEARQAKLDQIASLSRRYGSLAPTNQSLFIPALLPMIIGVVKILGIAGVAWFMLDSLKTNPLVWALLGVGGLGLGYLILKKIREK